MVGGSCWIPQCRQDGLPKRPRISRSFDTVRGRFGVCSVSGIHAGVKRVDASAGPGQAGGGFLGRHFQPATLRPRRFEIGGPGCEQDRRTGLRMEALGAQRRRFHVGSLGDGHPGANGSTAQSALGQGVVRARWRTCEWLKPDPCHKWERVGTWACGNCPKVMASLPLARWHGGCLRAR